MLAKRCVNIAICIQYVCAAITLFGIYSSIRWIGSSAWLAIDRFPWVPFIVVNAMIVAVIVGIVLFLGCMWRGNPRQRIVSFFPGLFLLLFLIVIIVNMIHYHFWVAG